MSSDEDRDAEAYAEWCEYREQENKKRLKREARKQKYMKILSLPIEFFLGILALGAYIYTEDKYIFLTGLIFLCTAKLGVQINKIGEQNARN